MKLTTTTGDDLHFSYCMNVHPGGTLQHVHGALANHIPVVRSALSPDAPFGVGLWVPSEASVDLVKEEELERLRQGLADSNTYAFTMNGFPFGAFHGERVKEKVYAPDWRSSERLAYTLRLMEILASLLPAGVDGSISTVPISFKLWNLSGSELLQATGQLMDWVRAAARLEEERGVCIHLGLEPEPCCFLETTEETLSFFEDFLLLRGPEFLQDVDRARAEEWIRRYLGVCVDTCHAALQFESPAAVLRAYRGAGVRVSKVQVSAALELTGGVKETQLLEPFIDQVYLHQVIAKANGGIRRWVDLPEFFADQPDVAEDLRVHFHVPLHWEGGDCLGSTRHTIDSAFWQELLKGDCRHVEVETYTFDVLPAEMRATCVEEDLIRECQWAMESMGSILLA